jgi:hypothetical protein
VLAYHGTNELFDEFKKPEINRMADRAAIGFWFTTTIEDAQKYGNKIIEVKLSAKKLKKITIRQLDMLAVSEPMQQLLANFRKAGFDGLYIEPVKADPAMDEKGQPAQYVVFDSSQIEIIKKPTSRNEFSL